MRVAPIIPARTAVLTLDLQNDHIHPLGAYSRAGIDVAPLVAVPGRIVPVVDAIRHAGGSFVSAQFTLVAGPGGEPLIASDLRARRPFLDKGDFCPGAFGHQLVPELQRADYTVETVAASAFYQSRLDHILRALGIDTLFVGGVVTDGAVAGTVRDAHLRDIRTILLSDGCAAFDDAGHHATLMSLGSVTQCVSCEDAAAMIGFAAQVPLTSS